MAFDLCRPGGQVLLVGMSQQQSEVDCDQHSQGAPGGDVVAYTPVDFERALEFLVGGEIDLDRYTVRMELERGQEAFEMITGRPGATLK